MQAVVDHEGFVYSQTCTLAGLGGFMLLVCFQSLICFKRGRTGSYFLTRKRDINAVGSTSCYSRRPYLSCADLVDETLSSIHGNAT